MSDKQANSQIPQHIAIIMDGNRRWARQNKLQVFKGHEKVAKENIKNLVEECLRQGVKYLTLWAFSTENWNRSKEEVEAILRILRKALQTDLEEINAKGVKYQVIGDLSRFPKDIQETLKEWQEQTIDNEKVTVTFALNYGGRDELLRSMRKMVQELSVAGHDLSKPAVLEELITKEKFEQFLDTADMPDPDMVIRPGGEERLSGFMLWQLEYAELFFTDILMPDFNSEQLNKFIEKFQQRKRRFGK